MIVPVRGALRILLMGLSVLTWFAVAGGVPVARAGTANAGIAGAARGNPLAGVAWGVYRGPNGGLYPAYAAAHGRNRQILGHLALKPITQFIGFWDSAATVRRSAQEIIADTTEGNPEILSQFSTFALNPWEGGACGGHWNVGDDEAWYRGLAAGIGDARSFVIVQVDLPFALCSSSPAPEQITAYGARTLAALPHTTVYIDAGAADWEPATTMASLLIRSGIRDARGFALDDSQYGATSLELQYGAQLVAALAADGVSGKHFVVDTDENGQPYLAGQVSGGSNDTPRCSTPTQTLCQRTGIPPTTDVADPRWHLPPASAAIAAADADAYVWSGQPWAHNGGGFSLQFALDLGANGEFS